ncbi:MAG: DUF4236 domain-containing protein [Hyphomicrobium sp.]|jgi:hypothetical protein
MGYFRFRKTFSILPGVRINLSKTGVSGSLGGHGATLNVGHGKENVTLGVPGTGLSYRTPASTALILALVVAAAVIGIAYLVAPDMVRHLLHWWQPRWF